MFTIRGWRKAREMTQEELAAKLNVSTQTICNWEKDSSVIPIAKCFELAKVFNVELNDIIFLPKDSI